MEVDIIARHVSGLLEFRKRVEELLSNAEAPEETDDIFKRLDGLDAWVAGIMPKIEQLIDARDAVEARLTAISDMQAWFTENRAGLDVLISIGDGLAAKTEAPPAAPTETAAETKPETSADDRPLAHVAEVEANLEQTGQEPAPEDQTGS